ncbi:bifunctional 3-demethylubiquinone-9 3-methyltransferase/ 2-octaprenyl-6-hydroxy phenol methylase [Actinomyces bovis]|uniref:Bifunctional 3-demethylubiquinone-9 3-methyltransferase/ 2-octaprenyl-6-hydroxy phenol methylase n=1 Tax=Actinomyces bovis TaxID=1658 RepID=A0ABY1VL05_9ACTO|nr:class I SAM-dependent methyltransferase [Actinomyces bovis]SPT52784.1 bifunctional 3-demethylubiquinone-9 3-methyltransferase/ 2-octaprenyl-6-hydroxy phenol methylase [Actinomyces bovis]VEG54811.1 bifunctional 3-demethylubiquinone-9 3-methyltransferase/ 2-octaprenyl-6-hydroxy phenol methylase [Actinomyces israelii]
MKNYDATTFGSFVADIYEQFYADQTEPTANKVDLLAELARGGSALDVGCGTGRMALALAERGISVIGVDSSPDMLDVLRAHDHRDLVSARLCDVTREPIEGRYRLAYLLFEVLLMVGDCDAQRSTLDNIVGVLEPGAHVLIEMSVFNIGEWAKFVDGAVRVSDMQPGRVVIGTSRYDHSTNRLDYQDVLISSDGIRLIPLTMYPLSPAELDTMARGAGLEMVATWSDWDRRPYFSGSPTMISVYRLP